MSYLSYIIWNASPEIFGIGTFSLRWYGLLFASGFLISQQILYYVYRKEGKNEKDIDVLTVYMVIATILGARLGHVFFYEPDKYLADPIKILKIWEGGLASHGAAIAILLAIWIYSKYNFVKGKFIKTIKPGQNFFQVVDRIVIVVALTGALIRMGNFFNSEIIGLPSSKGQGVVFAHVLTDFLKADEQNIASVSYAQTGEDPSEIGTVPLKILIDFYPDNNKTEADYQHYVDTRVFNLLANNPYVREHFHQSGFLTYDLAQNEDGSYSAIIRTYGVARHPAQLYEAISCVILFFILFAVWWKKQLRTPQGLLLGIFLIVCFGMRFVFEFLKENQVAFEDSMQYNMGQLLSIPLVLLGIYFTFRALTKKET
ncbi:MAG TPA: prolipoprotein diacylglyceryl transferase [Cyclobacteriaceae bacterium]|nr:prolipoprotein diacylglyceryl transferase [Cyclobacteriaceae bacterium]